jgi:glycosyltransferase involved in cell wall biosynthesis
MRSPSTPEPFLSVLIPCWNAEGSIGRAIASVLEARSVALECIVVDDGSTDRTADLVADIAAGDVRVVLVRLPENGGVSNARNVGLERSRGEWLTLLDADDRFLPGGLETLSRAALQAGTGAVIGQQVWWDGRRHRVLSLYDIPDIRRPGRKSLAVNPGLLNSLSPHAKVLHRATYDGLRFSGRVLGDQPWIARALIRAGTGIVVLEDTVYEWYRPPADTAGSGSITATTRASARRSVEAVHMATEAFTAVADEAAQRLDAAGREVILVRYAERLAQSDLAPYMSRALRRRDPDASELIDAVRGFVDGPAGACLARTASLARDILEPPLRGWSGLDEAGRIAFGRLADAVLALDPKTPRRRPPLARLGLWLGLRRHGGAAHRLAALLLTIQWLAEGVGRRLRRLVRR